MKKPTAEDLIEAERAPRFDSPPPEALEELRKLVEYNASAGPRRVSAPKAIAMLQAYGWEGKSREDLNDVCRTHFDRHSWGKA